MVDGDEEVDTILFEFNVSVYCLFVTPRVASWRPFVVLFFGFARSPNLEPVRSGPGLQKLSGKLGESPRNTCYLLLLLIYLSWRF